MYDEHGKRINKAEAIHRMDKLRIAHLLNDIKKNPEKYPNDVCTWIEWLNSASGDSVDNL